MEPGSDRRANPPGGDSFGPVHRFGEAVAGDAMGIQLDRAALAIVAALRRDVDEDEAMTELDALADGVDGFDDLRHQLYERHRFAGACPPSDDPNLSFLDVVLARRRGLPILLGAVMIEVGRRAGVPVLGVNLPLHFLVCDGRRPDVLVDPCTGRPLDADGARAVLERLAHGRVTWSDRHLRPVPNRHVVIRMLTNLQAAYQRRDDPVRSAIVARLRVMIPELAQETPAAVRLGAVFN